MVKRGIIVLLLAAMLSFGGIIGCAGLNLQSPITDVSNKNIYAEALGNYLDLWDKYHKVWEALPEDTKAEWVEKYHPTFKQAGDFLIEWAKNQDDPLSPGLWNVIRDTLEGILIKAMVKEGK